jgi:hypothetical protein
MQRLIVENLNIYEKRKLWGTPGDTRGHYVKGFYTLLTISRSRELRTDVE